MGSRQSQLLLPLLDVLGDARSGLTAQAAADGVAERIGLDAGVRRARAVVSKGGGQINLFDRDVRWARQRAVALGQVDSSVRNLWRLTPHGRSDLKNATPGLVITIFETSLGRALWAEAESAFGTVDDGSVNLFVTSPPYPIERQKDYGGLKGDEYLEWMTALAAEWKRCLAPDGSLVLNLGDAWTKGQPTLSLYQERLLLRLCDDLGYHLAQRMTWHNPSKMPAPAEYVTVRRVRVTPAVETLWWLSPGPNPKADNRRVLRPYSESMKRLLRQGGEKAASRPSGHDRGDGAFSVDHGGSIPHNLITAANTQSNDEYRRFCRDRDFPLHPATFPAAVPEFFVNLCTDPGDLVSDPFFGSGTVGGVCERLGRRWLGVERSLSYLQGAIGRFPDAAVA